MEDRIREPEGRGMEREGMKEIGEKKREDTGCKGVWREEKKKMG